MDSLIVEDVCDQCQGEAVLLCEECQNSYCASCSLVRHRVGKRQSHSTVRISRVPNIPISPMSPWRRMLSHRLNMKVKF